MLSKPIKDVEVSNEEANNFASVETNKEKFRKCQEFFEMALNQKNKIDLDEFRQNFAEKANQIKKDADAVEKNKVKKIIPPPLCCSTPKVTLNSKMLTKISLKSENKESVVGTQPNYCVAKKFKSNENTLIKNYQESKQKELATNYKCINDAIQTQKSHNLKNTVFNSNTCKNIENKEDHLEFDAAPLIEKILNDHRNQNFVYSKYVNEIQSPGKVEDIKGLNIFQKFKAPMPPGENFTNFVDQNLINNLLQQNFPPQLFHSTPIIPQHINQMQISEPQLNPIIPQNINQMRMPRLPRPFQHQQQQQRFHPKMMCNTNPRQMCHFSAQTPPFGYGWGKPCMKKLFSHNDHTNINQFGIVF